MPPDSVFQEAQFQKLKFFQGYFVFSFSQIRFEFEDLQLVELSEGVQTVQIEVSVSYLGGIAEDERAAEAAKDRVSQS